MALSLSLSAMCRRVMQDAAFKTSKRSLLNGLVTTIAEWKSALDKCVALLLHAFSQDTLQAAVLISRLAGAWETRPGTHY